MKVGLNLRFLTSMIFLAAWTSGCIHAQSKSREKVIIVGAGMSGLSAATALLDSGRFDVIVLEARDRVGGRIWTDRQALGAPIDLGASWIHGQQGNPLSKLVKDGAIHVEKTDYESSPETHSATGKLLSIAERRRMDSLFKAIQNDAYEDQEKSLSKKDVSLGSAFEGSFAKRKLSQTERLGQRHLLMTNIEVDYATEADKMSLKNWDKIKEFGGEDVLFPEGYDQVPKLLEKRINSEPRHARILLSHPVKSIDYSGSTVKAVTLAGEEFFGDRVIVTLPLGVLQKGAVQFVPALPQRKTDAIRRLGFGLFDKLYLRFNTRFWSQKSTWIEYVGENPRAWPLFLNISKHVQTPILAGFNVGDHASLLENKSDQEVIKEAMGVLRTIYGNIPNPISYKRTNWAQDPYSYGSYSYVPLHGDIRDLDIIGEPVNDILFFAGEATSSEHYSTVHAAYLSGIRAAREILSR